MRSSWAIARIPNETKKALREIPSRGAFVIHMFGLRRIIYGAGCRIFSSLRTDEIPGSRRVILSAQSFSEAVLTVPDRVATRSVICTRMSFPTFISGLIFTNRFWRLIATMELSGRMTEKSARNGARKILRPD